MMNRMLRTAPIDGGMVTSATRRRFVSGKRRARASWQRGKRRRCYTLQDVAQQPRCAPPMWLILDLLAIAACGGAGALLAWLVVSPVGWRRGDGLMATRRTR